MLNDQYCFISIRLSKYALSESLLNTTHTEHGILIVSVYSVPSIQIQFSDKAWIPDFTRTNFLNTEHCTLDTEMSFSSQC